MTDSSKKDDAYDPEIAAILGLNYKLAILETAIDSATRSARALQETLENCHKAAQTQQGSDGEKG